MYVLTDGWYSDMDIKGVVHTEEEARAWGDSGRERDYYGPFEPGQVPDAD
ncbi:hypothetical protein ABZ192_12555 [Streptomyces sp. NPDC006235]